MNDSQATDFVTFDPRVLVFVTSPSALLTIKFFLLHNVAKWSKCLIQYILTEYVYAFTSYRRKRQADVTFLFEYILLFV